MPPQIYCARAVSAKAMGLPNLFVSKQARNGKLAVLMPYLEIAGISHASGGLRPIQLIIEIRPVNVFKEAAACHIVAVVLEQIAVHHWQRFGDVPAL